MSSLALCFVCKVPERARLPETQVARREKKKHPTASVLWLKWCQLPCFTWQIRSLLLTGLGDLLRLFWHVCTQTNEVGTEEEVPVKWYGLLHADLLRCFFVPSLFGVRYPTDPLAYQLPGRKFFERLKSNLSGWHVCSWNYIQYQAEEVWTHVLVAFEWYCVCSWKI